MSWTQRGQGLRMSSSAGRQSSKRRLEPSQFTACCEWRMPEAWDKVPVPGVERAAGVALLRFATALCSSTGLAELEHKLVTGFGRMIYAPMYTPVHPRSADWPPVACCAGERQRDHAGAL